MVETAGSSSRTYTSANLPPSAPLATNWLDSAVSHYIHNFVITSDRGLPGLHDNIPRLYSAFPDRVYFRNAVQAVALAHLARVNQMGSNYLRSAEKLHANAVRLFRLALNDNTEARSATALMATELLWQYDVSISQPEFTTISQSSSIYGPLLVTHFRLLTAAARIGYCQGAYRKSTPKRPSPNTSITAATRHK